MPFQEVIPMPVLHQPDIQFSNSNGTSKSTYYILAFIKNGKCNEVVSPIAKVFLEANLQASAKLPIRKDTITSCRVNWKVNNIAQTPINYNNL